MDPRQYVKAVEEQGRSLYAATKKYRVSVPCGRSGPWMIDHYDTKMDLQYLRFHREGRPPGIGKVTRLSHKDRGTVMSDTVAEIDDLMRYVHNLRGNVLITGLGLGMVVHILTKVPAFSPQVKTITVVEKDAHVCELVAPHYLKTKKVAIVNADAFEWLPSEGARFDSAWHDIWDVVDEQARAEYGILRRRFSRFVTKGQQYCWGQHSR